MSCPRFDQLLQASSFRPLEGAEHAEFEGHLLACGACADHLRGYVLTTQLLQGLKAYEDSEAIPPLRSGLLERILAARAAEAPRRHETA